MKPTNWLRLLILTCIAAASTGRPLRAQDITTETYKLPNDMIVILHEDHSVPVACVNTWYYVGSTDTWASASLTPSTASAVEAKRVAIQRCRHSEQ